MTLTIPRAGVEAGRAANMTGQPLAIDPAAEGLAKLGSAITEGAAKFQAENDAMILNRMNIDMARDMGRAQLELAQSNDPNVDQAWQAKTAEIRARYVDAQELHPGLRERATLVYDEMNNRHALEVGKQAIANRSSYRGAQYIEALGTVTAEAATAPQASLETMLTAVDDMINTRLAAGDLTPEQAAQERMTQRTNVMTTRARAEIARDPEAFLANNEQYKPLGTTHSDLILDAEVAIAARNEKAAKAEEAAIKEQQTAIGDALQNIQKIYADGGVPKDENLMERQEVKNHPLYPEVIATRDLAREKKFLPLMTPPELEAALAEDMAKPKGYAYELARQKVLREQLEATKTAWGKNGVDAAKTAGLLPADDVLQFDPANPQAFAAGLAKRLNFDDTIRPKYTRYGQAIVGTEEAAPLQAVIAPEADAAPKVALLKAYAAQTAPAAQVDAALAAIGGGAVEKRALRLLRDTGDAALVERVLRGQQQVKLGVVSLPPEKSRQMVFAEATGGVFDDSPQLAQQIMEAASAVYAAEAAGVNPDGDNAVLPWNDDTAAQDMFRSAVQRVTGVATDANGEPVIGGLQDVNGAKVVLPQGMHRSEVEEALDNATYQLRGMQFNAVAEDWVDPTGYTQLQGRDLPPRIAEGMAPDGYQPSAEMLLEQSGDLETMPSPGLGQKSLAKRIATAKTLKADLDPMRAFRTASAVGQFVPALGPNPASILQDVQFRAVVDPRTNDQTGVYEMVRMVNGRPELIPIEGDPLNRAYRFRMTDFIKATRE